MSRSVLFAVVVLAVVSPSWALLESGYTQTQTIFASSDSESPITANSTATAIATLTFTPTTICYDIFAISPASTNLTAAHIHQGVSNVSGPVFVALFAANATVPAKLKDCITVDTAKIDAILGNKTAYYFNAHSTAQPAGAFRGQLGSTFLVNVLGSQEVPASNSTANGSVQVTVGDTYVCYSNLSISTGLSSLTQGHIHDGNKTTAGPVIIPLFSGTPAVTNCTGKLDPESTGHLLEYPGEHYVNVHSSQFPAGAARAQLVDSAEFTARLTLYATTTAEVPPRTPNSTALNTINNVTVTLNITPTSICYAIANVSSSVTAIAHIHKGTFDVAGPVVIPLFSGLVVPGCAAFDETDVLFDLVQNPEQYYFNIHNSDYPAGVARAQLGPSLSIPLSGSEQSPPTNATGSIIVTLGRSSVCYSNLTYSGPTSDLTQGHIHNGTAGTAGPVVVPLFTGVPPATACTPADPASIAAIVAAPAQYYVNIHSTAYAAGVIRAQLGTNQTVLNTF